MVARKRIPVARVMQKGMLSCIPPKSVLEHAVASRKELLSLQTRWSRKSSLGRSLKKSDAQHHSLVPTQVSPGKHSRSLDLGATVLPKDVVGNSSSKRPQGFGVWAAADLETSSWSYSLRAASGLDHECSRPWVLSDLLP